MNKFARFAVAGALLAGAQASFGQALPSSNSSDLWLFVSDSATATTFAEDTGISVNSLLPASDMTANAANGTPVSVTGTSINVAASTALASFISTATAAGQASDLTWAVEAAQYNTTTAKANTKNQGLAIDLASANISQAASVGTIQLGGFQTALGGFNGDVTYLASTYAAGGTSYKIANGSSAGNVWGAGTGDVAGSTNWYAQGIDQSGTGLGVAETLFGMTGSGGTGNVESYDLTDSLVLTANGTLQNAQAPVPVPAAVWLFGSGLLGLMGVGRRRAA